MAIFDAKTTLKEFLGLDPVESVVSNPSGNLPRQMGNNLVSSLIDLLGIDTAQESLQNLFMPLEIRGLKHGSPYRFAPTKNNPLGEFQDKYIGKGQGAASFSPGIYQSTGDPVAESYARMRPRDEVWNPRPSTEKSRKIVEEVASKYRSDLLDLTYKYDDLMTRLTKTNDILNSPDPWEGTMTELQRLKGERNKLYMQKDDLEGQMHAIMTQRQREIAHRQGLPAPEPTIYESTAYKGREDKPMIKWYEPVEEQIYSPFIDIKPRERELLTKKLKNAEKAKEKYWSQMFAEEEMAAQNWGQGRDLIFQPKKPSKSRADRVLDKILGVEDKPYPSISRESPIPPYPDLEGPDVKAFLDESARIMQRFDNASRKYGRAEAVQEKLRNRSTSLREKEQAVLTGENFFDYLQYKLGGRDKAQRALREKGIGGVIYPADSLNNPRGARWPDQKGGFTNYVFYDPSDLTIENVRSLVEGLMK